MRKITIYKTIEIAAAHRQFLDPSKCGGLHGHNWIFQIKMTGPVGPLGYIVDFKDIRNVVDKMDHKTILHKEDPLAELLINHKQPVFTLEMNPTCEHIASFLANTLEVLYSATQVDVSLRENSTAYAPANNEDH